MSDKEKNGLTSEQQQVIVSLWKAHIKSLKYFDDNRHQNIDMTTVKELVDFSLSKTLIDMLDPNEEFPCVFHLSSEACEHLKEITGAEINVMVGDIKWIERFSEIHFSKDYLKRWFDFQRSNLNVNCIELEIARLIFTKTDDYGEFCIDLKNQQCLKQIIKEAYFKCDMSYAFRNDLKFKEMIEFSTGINVVDI